MSRSQDNPGLETIEAILQGGNPIVVLIWTGSTLHWTMVTGTYEQNGTVMVQFANHNDQTWDWFVHQWSFAGLDWPAPDVLSWQGFNPYTWMRYVETGQLNAGHAIAEGFENSIRSQDGRFALTLIGGDIGLYEKVSFMWNPVPLWHSNTYGSGARAAVMQADGNFVLYDSGGHAVWSTHTQGHPGAYLAVQNDGNAVIYQNTTATVLWESYTCCR